MNTLTIRAFALAVGLASASLAVSGNAAAAECEYSGRLHAATAPEGSTRADRLKAFIDDPSTNNTCTIQPHHQTNIPSGQYLPVEYVTRVAIERDEDPIASYLIAAIKTLLGSNKNFGLGSSVSLAQDSKLEDKASLLAALEPPKPCSTAPAPSRLLAMFAERRYIEECGLQEMLDSIAAASSDELNIEDEHGRTPLHYASHLSLGEESYRNGKLALLNAILGRPEARCSKTHSTTPATLFEITYETPADVLSKIRTLCEPVGSDGSEATAAVEVETPRCAAVDGSGSVGECIIEERIIDSTSTTVAGFEFHVLSDSLSFEFRPGRTYRVELECLAEAGDRCAKPLPFPNTPPFGFVCAGMKTERDSLAAGEIDPIEHTYAGIGHILHHCDGAMSSKPFSLRSVITRQIR